MEHNLRELGASNVFKEAARKSSFDFVNVFKVNFLFYLGLCTFWSEIIKKLSWTSELEHLSWTENARSGQRDFQVRWKGKNETSRGGNQANLNWISDKRQWLRVTSLKPDAFAWVVKYGVKLRCGLHNSWVQTEKLLTSITGADSERQRGSSGVCERAIVSEG